MASDLAQRVEQSSIAGCSVGRLQRGQEPEFAFGGVCSTNGAAMSRSAIWEAASLSKPVVALLATTNALADPTLLQQPLTTDLAGFGADSDARWDAVNLFQLLTHGSGLPNWRDEGQLLGFESDPGTPGYSGEGYELMLSELAHRSGVAAGPLLDEHLARLGMSASTFTPDPSRDAATVIGHDESGAAVPKQYWSEPKAASSLHTTIDEYMRFLRLIARPNEAASPELKAATERLTKRETEVIPGYGRTLGWSFNEGDHGDVLWQHGDNPGFKHVAAARPATGEAIVVFTNDDNGQPFYRDLCRDFLDVEVW